MFKSIPIILIFSTSKNLALIYTGHNLGTKKKELCTIRELPT